MKTNFSKEVLLGLKEQYPEKWKKFSSFFESPVPTSSRGLSGAMETYSDMIETLDFIVELIRELEVRNGRLR